MYNINQFENLTMLGVTFQPNCRFTEHIKAKLSEAYRCLYVLRGSGWKDIIRMKRIPFQSYRPFKGFLWPSYIYMEHVKLI